MTDELEVGEEPAKAWSWTRTRSIASIDLHFGIPQRRRGTNPEDAPPD